jgi:elongation factor 1-delta
VPLAYGIHKLQISCVVEDEKVSVDWLQENIESIEDYVSTVVTVRVPLGGGGVMW